MAKNPKAVEPKAEAIPADEPADNRIPVELSVAQVEKARKHMQARLRQLIHATIYSNGEAGLIARTVQDIHALDMINPMLGAAPLPQKPKLLSAEEAAAEQAAAHERHKRDEEAESQRG